MITSLLLATAVNFTIQTACHPDDFKHYDTTTLRDRFVMEKVFEADRINATYSMYDRFVYGGAMPVDSRLELEGFDALKSKHFLDRREMGVVNVGGKGVVVADGVSYDLDFKDALYLPCGTESVVFSSVDAANPAKFYFNAALAFKRFVPQLITTDEAKAKADPAKWTLGNKIHAGSLAESNDRVINQLIVWPVMNKREGGGVNQLQLGLTELATGSVWNTMPQHTHQRRMETYFYFNLPATQAICHQMGEPQEQRIVWLHNEQAVANPEWSVHSAAGTSNYMFIWGMAGENLDYGDMDRVPISAMR